MWPGTGLPIAPGFATPIAAQEAEHQVALGLAVELVDREAERLAAPGEGLGAERLAARTRSCAALSAKRPRGFGTVRSILSAVGGTKVLRTL